MRSTRNKKRLGKTRRQRQRGAGVFSSLFGEKVSPPQETEPQLQEEPTQLNIIAAKLEGPGPVVLTSDEIVIILDPLKKILNLLDKNTDTFAEELMSSNPVHAKEVLKILMPDFTEKQLNDLLQSAAVNTNTATKAEIFKPKSRVGNLFRATNTGANYKGPVTAATRTNAASIKFYEESKAQIKKRLDAFLLKVNAPNINDIKEMFMDTIAQLEAALPKTSQSGGGDSSLNEIINRYVSTHREIPINKQRLAMLYGVALIGVRLASIAAVANNIGMIVVVIKCGAAAAIAPLLVITKVIGGLFTAVAAVLFTKNYGGSPNLVTAASTGHLHARGYAFWSDFFFSWIYKYLSGPKVYNPYEFVTTRLTTGMRIYNPFRKLNIPFHLLPTPDAIRYIMSFIFFKSPALEPYGPEVSILYQDSQFDESIKNLFEKFLPSITSGTFNVDGSELPGFIGNLFIGNGLKYNITIKPHKTIIDDRERPWAWNDREEAFTSLLSSEDRAKTRTYIGAIGLGLDPNKTTKTIPNRSKEHPAYALNMITGFRNAIYLAARWKLSTTKAPVVQLPRVVQPLPVVQLPRVVQNPLPVVQNPLPVVQNPLPVVQNRPRVVQPLPVVQTSAIPSGWVKLISEDGEPYYECEHTEVTQWDIPTEACLPAGWKQIKLRDGRKAYQCEYTGVSQLAVPTKPC